MGLQHRGDYIMQTALLVAFVLLALAITSLIVQANGWADIGSPDKEEIGARL